MYHKYYTLLMLAGCFSGHLFGRADDNNPGVDKGSDIIFESMGEELFVGPISRKSSNLKYAQIRVEEGQETSSSHVGLSGYHALKNAFLTKSLIDSKPENRQGVVDDFKSTALNEELFGKNDSLWSSEVITSRKKNLAALYLRDRIILGLRNCTKTSNSDEFVFNFYTHAPISLSLEKARVTLDKTKVTEEQLHDMRTICSLAKLVGQEIVESHWEKKDEASSSSKEDSYVVTRDEIMDAFVKVADKKQGQEVSSDQERRLQESLKQSSLKTKESFEAYFEPFEDQEFTLVSDCNQNELIVQGQSFHKEVHGPASDRAAKDGSWLLRPEIIEIAQKEKNDESHIFHEEFKVPMDVHAFDFSESLSEFEKMTTKMRCSDVLKGITKGTSPLTTMFLIVQDNRWFACVITKLANDFWFIVTDSRNEDRSNDPLIATFVGMMSENTTKKLTDVKKFLDQAGPAKDQKEELTNYDAPLASISLEDLPQLEDFFGGRLTNDIRMILNQLKAPITPLSKPNKETSGLILYGPPGTGKSTTAQIIARLAGREVLYAGGGDFRTAYQGSSKAKLDDLFRKAKELNKPCVILIDEIDGTTSKNTHASTPEDNRAIKALITTLDQYQNDPYIYVIGTTNYPEKMDPAIVRRFDQLEVPLPNYEVRRKIVDLYLRKNGLEVNDNDPKAISSSFYEMFITATKGFSGDALKKIINKAYTQAQSDLIPEKEINTRFRLNLIDASNHSILSTAANAIALPFYQAFHWLGCYTHSEMDQHIYSQFANQQKTRADLQEREFEDQHKGHKFSDLLNTQYLGYLAGTMVLQAGANAFISSAKDWQVKDTLKAMCNRVGFTIP